MAILLTRTRYDGNNTLTGILVGADVVTGTGPTTTYRVTRALVEPTSPVIEVPALLVEPDPVYDTITAEAVEVYRQIDGTPVLVGIYRNTPTGLKKYILYRITGTMLTGDIYQDTYRDGY